VEILLQVIFDSRMFSGSRPLVSGAAVLPGSCCFRFVGVLNRVERALGLGPPHLSPPIQVLPLCPDNGVKPCPAITCCTRWLRARQSGVPVALFICGLTSSFLLLSVGCSLHTVIAYVLHSCFACHLYDRLRSGRGRGPPSPA
jgi:hypothetical protein